MHMVILFLLVANKHIMPGYDYIILWFYSRVKKQFSLVKKSYGN
jgi:hypothetical protein